MNAAVEWIVGMTLWTALVVAAARIADRLLERRVSARARMALYAAVAVRLALPVRWDGGVATSAATSAVTTVTSSVIGVRGAVFPSAGDGTSWLAATLLAIYAAGVIALMAARIVAGRRATAGLRPARPSLAALAADVPVFESDEFGPAVVGALRPRIVVPSRLAGSADAETLAWIVRHETSHVRAHDPMVLAATQFVVAALWPVLPLRFALARVRSLMEVACDERTLAASPDGRRSYVRALLDVAETGSRRVRPAAALAFGHGLAERSRVLASSARVWPRAAQTLGVAAVATGLVACASSASVAPARVADGVLLSVDGVPGAEVTVTGDDGVERSSAVHVVNARLFAARPGAPLVVRSSGSIVMSTLGGAGAPAPSCVRFSGDAPVDGIEFVEAPSVLAIDGERSSVTLDWRQDEPDSEHCCATYTVRSAGDGAVDLLISFEQREGGVLVRDVPATTIRLAAGEKALIATRSRTP